MNECFLIGKIISDIDFKFIIKSKNISIANFKVKLLDGNIIKVKGNNNIADFCYRLLQKGKIVSIYGILNSRGEIEIKEVELYQIIKL